MITQLTTLIVENDDIVRSFALQSLPHHHKIIAENAQSGLQQFRRYHPDITFLDIILPDGSGLDLLHKIRAIDPHAFIIMITGNAEDVEVTKAKEYGASGYIIKPFSITKVQHYIKQYLNNQ